MKKKLFIYLSATILLLLVIVMGVINYFSESPVDKPQESPSPTVAASPTSSPISHRFGYITGSLSYPSEGIPESLTVCALDVNENDEFCTDSHIESDEYTYGLGYELQVTPGTYQVYAFIPDSGFTGYYSDFVECGLSVECNSHELIEVEVKPGETVENIDPGDWYAPQSTQSGGLNN